MIHPYFTYLPSPFREEYADEYFRGDVSPYPGESWEEIAERQLTHDPAPWQARIHLPETSPSFCDRPENYPPGQSPWDDDTQCKHPFISYHGETRAECQDCGAYVNPEDTTHGSVLCSSLRRG